MPDSACWLLYFNTILPVITILDQVVLGGKAPSGGVWSRRTQVHEVGRLSGSLGRGEDGE